GRPKGCVLTHRSFFAECGNVVERLKPLSPDSPRCGSTSRCRYGGAYASPPASPASAAATSSSW
ncbi:hypothetical protein, partial [Streptomyces rimosus]|uniref:hypothetical protein n=1 Tax=Streptomyces rimosus TaxID=1927 RepID=UPI0033EA570D